MFRSEDRGATWTRQNPLNPRPSYYSQIRIDPTNPNKVWVLGSPLFRVGRRRQDVPQQRHRRPHPRGPPRPVDKSCRPGSPDARQRRRAILQPRWQPVLVRSSTTCRSGSTTTSRSTSASPTGSTAARRTTAPGRFRAAPTASSASPTTTSSTSPTVTASTPFRIPPIRGRSTRIPRAAAPIASTSRLGRSKGSGRCRRIRRRSTASTGARQWLRRPTTRRSCTTAATGCSARRTAGSSGT